MVLLEAAPATNGMSTTETISSAISALAAVIAVIMAGWTVMESRRLREATTSPEVVVYLDRNARVFRVIDLVVRNIGNAPAYNIMIKAPNKPIPFGFFASESVYMLQHGLRFMAPGQEYRFSLNTYSEMAKDEVIVDVSYYAKEEIETDKERHTTFTLRPLEQEGYSEFTDREREAQIALTEAMKALVRGKITIKLDEDEQRTIRK